MSMNYQEIIALSYGGDGPEKLEKAKGLFNRYGESLLARDEIVSALEVLRQRVVSLDAQMTAMEMGKNCAVCALLPKGGCCSAYMGHENNDVLQLLMNMLGGVDVQLVRDDEVECCFLGANGCILLFKPIFCLNYLCERIRTNSKHWDLQELEKKTGALLTAQVECERLLIACLQLRSEEK